MSYFKDIELLPEDAILSLPILFAADKHAKKVNLGIGSYKDIHGIPLVLDCVRKAEQQILNAKLDKEYLPIQGHPEYISATQKLVFGDLFPTIAERTFTMQTVGGTSALRIGGEFLARNGFKNLFLPDSTWPNHRAIFTYAGLTLDTYPYYDFNTHDIDFSKMCMAISRMPERSIILFHACCHNPSGIDPTPQQWQELSSIVKKYKLIPFFDMAYQGFSKDLETDAFPVRLFAKQGHEMLVATSYSKNMGLYGERAGSLSFIAENPDCIKRVTTHLKQIVRGMYSMPPLCPGRIVATVLNDANLKKLWVQELADMRTRVNEMRQALVTKLRESGIEFSFLERQTGLFCYLGLSPDQVQKIRNDFGIYVANSGRANVAALTWDNIDTVVTAMRAVLKGSK